MLYEVPRGSNWHGIFMNKLSEDKLLLLVNNLFVRYLFYSLQPLDWHPIKRFSSFQSDIRGYVLFDATCELHLVECMLNNSYLMNRRQIVYTNDLAMH